VVEPDKIWLEGARSQVMKTKEVETEKIDIAGLTADAQREARLVISGSTIWPADATPIRVLVRIEPDPKPATAAPAARPGRRGGA
jgi:hypothetical protein